MFLPVQPELSGGSNGYHSFVARANDILPATGDVPIDQLKAVVLTKISPASKMTATPRTLPGELNVR